MEENKACEGCESKSTCSGTCPSSEETIEQVLEKMAMDEQLRKIKHKIIVLSGKGGVGKSTVSANLAVSLALAGKKVGLLDVDIHGPSIPRLLHLENETVVSDGLKIIPSTVGENLKVMSIGFLLPDQEDAIIWRGPMKYSVIKQFISDVDWGELDYLVVDSPPGTGDEPLSVIQLLENPDGAVIVTTPQDLSTADVRRSINFCHKMNLAVLGVIENMSGFICPHCGERTDIFKSGGGEKMAKEMGVPFLGKIPIDPKIVEASDSGTPYIYHYAKTEAAKAFETVIQPLLDIDNDD
ncbi:MAG: Mrp/NBP35 family ATP-binding protein [Armatimonadota bacterium]|nr:Mrp/NBP35 family ATP-binding protein [bacterium]